MHAQALMAEMPNVPLPATAWSPVRDTNVAIDSHDWRHCGAAAPGPATEPSRRAAALPVQRDERSVLQDWAFGDVAVLMVGCRCQVAQIRLGCRKHWLMRDSLQDDASVNLASTQALVFLLQ